MGNIKKGRKNFKMKYESSKVSNKAVKYKKAPLVYLEEGI